MPFDISPDPSFFWLSEKHKEALAHLKYGLIGDKRFIVITGDVGTGKTAMIKRLVKTIDASAIVVTIPDPDMSRLDFYNFLAYELKMGKQFKSKGEFLIHFKNFLLQAYRSYKKVLLIIDEAQRLSHNILQEVRLLANIDFGGHILINIFLVGQNEFNDILMDDRNRSVRDRITASYQIEPLTQTEVSSYIRHRLRVAGTTNPIFSREAEREIYAQTRGYPRVINILCDRALVIGFIKERQLIDRGIIRESAHDLRITINRDKPGKKKTPSPVPDEPVAFPVKSNGEITSALKKFAYVSPFLILGLLAYFFSDSLFENFKQLKNFPLTTRITGWLHGTETGNPWVEKQAVIESIDALKNAELSSAAMAKPQQSPDAFKRKQIMAPSDEHKKSGDDSPAEIAESSIVSAGKKANFVVYFDYSSNEIPPRSMDMLNHITEIFFKSPVKDIIVKGYTDFYGNENYEKYMSVERAMQVRNFFVSKGIPASSLSVYGMGSENPGGINTTAEERRKSRRVEIEVNLAQVRKQ
jgi:general secretion pathway protein A